MDILLYDDGVLAYTGESITFGKLDPSEPTVDKWKLADNLFAIGEFTLVQDVTIPDGVTPGKHKYVDGAFAMNPDWSEPVTIESLQQQVTELQLALATLVEGSGS